MSFTLNQFWKSVFIPIIFFPPSHLIHAQGLGPRTNLLSPIEVSGVAVQYVNLHQNISPSTIFSEQTTFEVNMLAVQGFHTFKLKNQFAQVVAAIIPSYSDLKLTENGSNESISFSSNGLADGYIGLKVGMIGTPALTVTKFPEHQSGFAMFSYLRLWYSGTYSSKEVLNLGSNRMTIQYIVPMAIPLNKNKERMTWLEISPNIRFFTNNTEPMSTSGKMKIKQKPLFTIENHLSHNFSKKFWVAANLEYAYGGRTVEDGIPNDNRINLLSASVSAGYKINPFFSISADYGKRVYGDNEIDSRMIRTTLVYSYFNTKKKNTK